MEPKSTEGSHPEHAESIEKQQLVEKTFDELLSDNILLEAFIDIKQQGFTRKSIEILFSEKPNTEKIDSILHILQNIKESFKEIDPKFMKREKCDDLLFVDPFDEKEVGKILDDKEKFLSMKDASNYSDISYLEETLKEKKKRNDNIDHIEQRIIDTIAMLEAQIGMRKKELESK